MVNYRRARIPGATYFFTVTLHPRRAKQGRLRPRPASLALGYSPLALALRDRRSRLLTEHADAVREAIRAVKRQLPFRTDAVVVLPDHLHTLWTLPEGDEDFAGRWRAIKARFTRLLLKRRIALERNRRGEYDLWQRRFLRQAQGRFGST